MPNNNYIIHHDLPSRKGYLTEIPNTQEVINPEMIEELILITEGHAKDSERCHISRIEKQDDEFSDIAFKEPVTWQMHGFATEDPHTSDEYYTISVGYDSVDFSKSPVRILASSGCAYRLLFMVQAMRFGLSKKIHYVSSLHYHDRARIRPEILPDWDLQYAAECVIRESKYYRHINQYSGSVEINDVGTAQGGRYAKEYLKFLIALRPFVKQQKEYTFIPQEMLGVL